MPAAVAIDPEKLIEAARDFAEGRRGRGRPRPLWLRRATSSAYYALYHCMARQAADHLLPNGTLQERLTLARSFNHAAVKVVCEWVAGRIGPAKVPREVRPLVGRLNTSILADVASAFCDLQEARHRADYDHLEPVSKATTLGYIQDADKAICDLAAAPPAEREAFFALMTLRTSLR